MNLGRVVGTVVSTSKCPQLIGFKLLIVEPLDEHRQRCGKTQVAVDAVGAGKGEVVITCDGSAARHLFQDEKPDSTPIDAAIIGIVDTVEVG